MKLSKLKISLNKILLGDLFTKQNSFVIINLYFRKGGKYEYFIKIYHTKI